MSITTDAHIKVIWSVIASMVIVWAMQVYATQSVINELKYNTGIELAKINTSLAQIQCTLNEIKE